MPRCAIASPPPDEVVKGVLPGDEGWAWDEEGEGMKGMKGVLPGERGPAGEKEGEGMKGMKGVRLGERRMGWE